MKMKGNRDVQDVELLRLAKLPLPAGEGRGEGERIPHFLASIETGC